MPASASPPPSPPVRTPGQQPSHPASATNRSRTPQNDRFALYSPRNPDRRWIRAYSATPAPRWCAATPPATASRTPPAARLALGHVDQAPQKAPGSMLVPVRAEHGVEEHPLAVDGAIERAPAPGDFHVGLVQVPGAAGVAAPLRSPPIREQRGEADLPGADRLVADLEAALEEQLGDVPEAELIAETPEHGEQHDVGRVLEIVERGAGPLVEPPPTVAAPAPRWSVPGVRPRRPQRAAPRCAASLASSRTSRRSR